MTEEEKYISILFDLKPPKNVRDSIINTIVLFLKEIAGTEDYQQWEDIDTLILNDNIDRAKRELDSLKIIKYEE